MPVEPLLDEDDHYVSSEDSDFRPDDAEAAARASEESDSDHEADAHAAAAQRKKDAATDGGELDNSGDEALVEKAKKRQRKKRARDDAGNEEDEGGEGGLVKTRSMRTAEKAEKKQAAVHGPVTIDVDALWAQMKAGKPPVPPVDTANPPTQPDDTPAPAPAPTAPDPPDMIRIKRKYNFAGKVHTEEKLVPRTSAEAKLYLESTSPADADADADATRPAPRKAFRSAFEPILEPHRRRGDLNLGVAARLEARGKDATRLNTVEKSRMDWAGFVDREGIKEELEMAGRAKGSFVEREGFLARSEARREEDARRARVAGMG